MTAQARATSNTDEKTVIMYITEKCNQACVFCLETSETWHGERTIQDPELGLVMQDMEKLRAEGCNHVTFMGGESLNRRDFLVVIARAKELGFKRIGVATNGVSSAKKGFLKELQEAGLNFVEISIHATDQELSKTITGRGFTWERQQKALTNLETLGSEFITIVNIVINRYNLAHIPDLIRDLTAGWNLNWIFKFKVVNLVGAANLDEAVGIAFKELDLTQVFDTLQDQSIAFWTSNLPLCRIEPRHRLYSSEAQGFALDRIYMTYDHQRQSGYFNAGHQDDGVQPKACEGCSLRSLCPGIEEAYLMRHGDSELMPQHQDPAELAEALLKHQDLTPPPASYMKDLLSRKMPDTRDRGPKQAPDAHRMSLKLEGEEHPNLYLDFFAATSEGPAWVTTTDFRVLILGHKGGEPEIGPAHRRLLRLVKTWLEKNPKAGAGDLALFARRLNGRGGIYLDFTPGSASLARRGREALTPEPATQEYV